VSWASLQGGLRSVTESACCRQAGVEPADSQSPERVSEMPVVCRINKGINEWIGITEPRQDTAHGVGDSTRRTERLDDVDDEERQPATDEATDDDR